MADRELLNQALAALMCCSPDSEVGATLQIKTVADLRTALAQPVQPEAKPVGYVYSETIRGYLTRHAVVQKDLPNGTPLYATPQAQPAPAPVVPDGWVMVPREPTHEMLYAMAELDGWRKGDRDHPMFTRWRDYWNAALAAAPGSAPAVPDPAMGNPISPMKPLTEEQVFASEWIMAANAGIGLGMQEIMVFVRAIEAHHGIGTTGGGNG